MKILRLRFKNINSFYGKLYTIDFTEPPLSETGLFIISGPTGAGKSTLLDVITLALYNEVPRFEKGVSRTEIDRLGSVVNAKAADEPRCEALAEVEYEVKSGSYRASWSIAKNRNGNWNNYQMEIARLPEGVLLEVKGLTDYPRKNTELIGLNYGQFIKSIVLAQGSFAEFLKADRHTRTKLLEDITGTHIYRTLGEASFRRFSESGGQIKLKEAELKGVVLKSPEEIAALSGKKAILEREREKAEKESDKWEREKKLVSDIGDLLEAKRRLGTEKEKLASDLAAFAPRRALVAGHESVSRFVAPVTRLTEVKKNVARVEEEVQLRERQAREIEAERIRLLSKGRELTGVELTDETFIGEINRFENEILALESGIKEQRAQASPVDRALRHEIAAGSYAWPGELSLTDYEQSLVVVKQLKDNLQQTLSRYPLDFDASGRLGKLDAEFETLSDLKALFAERERLEGEGRKARTEQEALAALEKSAGPELNAVRENIAGLRQEIDRKTVELVNETTRQSLEEHRNKLTEGEPCPLCGSTHHPFLHAYVNRVTGLGDEISAMKKKLGEFEKEEKRLALEVEGAVKRRVDLSERLNVLRTDYKVSDGRIKELLSKINMLPDTAARDISERLKALQEERTAIDRWARSREQTALAGRLTEGFNVLIATRNAVKRLEEDRKRKYRGENIQSDVKEILGHWGTMMAGRLENHKRLQQLEKEATAIRADLGVLMEKLTADLKEAGLSSPEEAQKRLLPEEEYKQFKGEEEKLKERTQRIEVQEKENTRALEEKAAARFFPEITAAGLALKLDEVKAAYRALVEEVAGIQSVLQTETESRNHFEKLFSELEALRGEHRKWELLKQYIGDATGNLFSGFAQSLTLSNLIGLANARLHKLSDRYVLDKPRNDTEGLYVLDTYYGNQARAVSTLSGGETFTVSLALALALSDLASRNVRIESLFIDEGFGTLDTETLESAVTILERLQDESSKTVGVISHRQEMKERIPVQIQVEKGADGASTIKITG